MEGGEIGASVRGRRRAAGMTLEVLAERSGVSATMLSEVERGLKNPTVKLAYQIARALGCSLSDLVEDPQTSAAAVLRADERISLVDPESGVQRHAISPEFRRRGLEVVSYRVPAGATTGEMAPNRAGILELVTVQAGRLTLLLGGQPHVLAPGDSATYGPQVATEYRNEGCGPCEFLLVSDSRGALP